MSTFTDTSLSISLATPEDIRELSQKSLHLWVGVTSPLWAPFWAAASFGVAAWTVGQGVARTLGGTFYDKDAPLAVKWPGFEALPKPVNNISKTVEAVVEDSVAVATDAVEDTQAAVAETVEAVIAVPAEVAPAEVAPVDVAPVEIAPVVEAVEATQAAVAETADAVVEAAAAVPAKTRNIAEASAKKAAQATLDLLASQPKPAAATQPLIDPVTEKPVIPALVEAVAEPKLPMPKPAPRRPRKS